MRTAASLRVTHPRHAQPLSKSDFELQKTRKPKRQFRRECDKKETKRRLLVALKNRQELETTRSRFIATTPPPVLDPANRDYLDVLLAKRTRASFGPALVLNAS